MTTVALLAALAGPPLFFVIPRHVLGDSPSLGAQLVLQLLYCGLAAFVTYVVVGPERQTLESIGVTHIDISTLVSAMLIAIVVLFVLPLATASVMRAMGAPVPSAELQRLAAMPLWFRLFVGATGGLVEETLYRGYAIERLSTLAGGRWVAAVISVTAFTVAHIPAWGIQFALAADLPFGIVMTIFYLWKRDLAANILAHSTALIFQLLWITP